MHDVKECSLEVEFLQAIDTSAYISKTSSLDSTCRDSYTTCTSDSVMLILSFVVEETLTLVHLRVSSRLLTSCVSVRTHLKFHGSTSGSHETCRGISNMWTIQTVPFHSQLKRTSHFLPCIITESTQTSPNVDTSMAYLWEQV